MRFTADKQTLEDLNILGKYKPGSVFSLFNQVQTAGGEKLLETMFRQPLTDPAAINQRSRIFQYFAKQQLAFPFDREPFAHMESYLQAAGDGNFVSVLITAQRKHLASLIVKDTGYQELRDGLLATSTIVRSFRAFVSTLDELDPDNPCPDQIRQAKRILDNKRLTNVLEEADQVRLSFLTVAKLDFLFRTLLRAELSALIEIIHYVDVYIAVATVATSKNFSYAEALPKYANELSAEEVYHPMVKKAVTNPVVLHQATNALFLTGANMAGKSTLMKALGIAVYLAHMGFPVAAKDMRFSVKDGMYSSINVPDNLTLGMSHFYAEVQRAKTIAIEVSQSKDLLVIFDELFKGTNVKDAYEATLAVTEAFAENRNCFFIISTHIIEVGEALKERCENFRFSYLPTIMEGATPRYTYQLKNGITSDRQGMRIIENEGIIDMIRSIQTT